MHELPITFKNYHTGTIATFIDCVVPKRDPDFVSNSQSYYWLESNSEGDYVIRKSDHWFPKTRSCHHNIWTIIYDREFNRNKLQPSQTGKCFLKDFTWRDYSKNPTHPDEIILSQLIINPIVQRICF
jgi:hypothetical protein